MDSSDRVVSEEINHVSPIVPTYGYEIARTLTIGAGVGLLVAGASILLERYVFAAVLCRAGTDATCSQAPDYAMIVAMIIGAIVGLLALIQARVFRPLLIVLAVVVSLWGLSALVLNYTWYWQLLVTAGIFAGTYLLYSWITRIRSFLVASIITIILVVLMRYIIMS